METSKDLDRLLLDHVGECGRYQILVLLAMALAAIPVALSNMVHVFTGIAPEYYCMDHYILSRDDEPSSAIPDTKFTINNASHDAYSLLSKFWTTKNDCATDVFVSFNDSYLSAKNGSVYDIMCERGCGTICYDRSQYHSTIVTEWDLVCDKQWLPALAQSMHMAGVTIGGILLGFIADRFGRRPCLIYCCGCGLLVSTLTAFSPNFAIYVVMRTLVGVFVNGLFNSAYTIGTEILGPSYRPLGAIGILCSYAIGCMLLAPIAYFIRTWRYVQLAISSSFLIGALYYWMAPESIRWLLTHGRIDEAVIQLKFIARTNNSVLPEEYEEFLQIEKTPIQQKTTPSTAGLLTSPTLVFRTMVLFFIWFTSNVVYYGLSLYATEFGSNDYLAVFFTSLVEVPALFFAMWALKRHGRRTSLCVALLLAACAMVSTWFLTDKEAILRDVLAVSGKLFVSTTLSISYAFTGEIYPTVVRNSGLGLATSGGKIGGIVAPYINLLGATSRLLPLLVLGGVALIGSVIVFTLPETHNQPLPDTIKEAENIKVTCCITRRNRDVKGQPDKTDVIVEASLEEKV